MRQDPTTPFMQRLTALRDGPLTNTDLGFWSTRRIAHFAAAEKALYGLHNTGVLYATCKNKDRDDINQSYVKDVMDVFVVKATCTGSHATAMNFTKAGLLGKIPRTAYYAKGMMVKLLTNLLPEEGLF
jgi:Mn-containing catalase